MAPSRRPGATETFRVSGLIEPCHRSYFDGGLGVDAGAGGGVGAGSVLSLAWMESSSTSKMSVAPGLMPERGSAPRSLYAKSEGIKSCHFDPTGISCRASVQPLMTLVKGNVAGWPLL